VSVIGVDSALGKKQGRGRVAGVGPWRDFWPGHAPKALNSTPKLHGWGIGEPGDWETCPKLRAPVVHTCVPSFSSPPPLLLPPAYSPPSALTPSLTHTHGSLDSKLAVAERQKATSTGKRADSLASQITSFKAAIASMADLVSGPVFAVVFMHRYRDSNPVIRALCLEYLATACVVRPNLFLSDKYLKYFGWHLSDKVRSSSDARERQERANAERPEIDGKEVEERRMLFVHTCVSACPPTSPHPPSSLFTHVYGTHAYGSHLHRSPPSFAQPPSRA